MFSTFYHFGSGPGPESTRKHGIVLLVFSACMILGASQEFREYHPKAWFCHSVFVELVESSIV
jgi:hypothetical protein